MEAFELSELPAGTHGAGWAAFADLEFIAQMLLVLAMAVVLAAIIAYHPTTRRKATTLDEFEQPKTYVMYSMVGAIITIIVKTMPSMALVVFGIGGLLRFRTNVGQAKDTGRVILVTVIGLACGLELYVVALMTTLLAWLLILALESQRVEQLVIQGLDVQGMARASTSYSAALRELGCKVLGEQKRVKKGSLTILYRTPRSLGRAELERHIDQLPGSEGDTLSWEGS